MTADGFPAWVAPGVKCVCVNGDGWRRGRGFSLARWVRLIWLGTPQLGCAYVISDLGLGEFTNDPVVSLRGFDGHYHVGNFRPLIARKSEAEDLAMFRDLARHPEPADA